MHGFPGDVNRMGEQNNDRWRGNNSEVFCFYYYSNATIIDTPLHSFLARDFAISFLHSLQPVAIPCSNKGKW